MSVNQRAGGPVCSSLWLQRPPIAAINTLDLALLFESLIIWSEVYTRNSVGSFDNMQKISIVIHTRNAGAHLLPRASHCRGNWTRVCCRVLQSVICSPGLPCQRGLQTRSKQHRLRLICETCMDRACRP